MEIQLAAPLGNFDRPSERPINRRAIGRNLRNLRQSKIYCLPITFCNGVPNNF